MGAVIGTARRSYRVYGEAVNTAIAISTTAGSGRVIIDGSTHKLIPPYLCITKRINVSGLAWVLALTKPMRNRTGVSL